MPSEKLPVETRIDEILELVERERRLILTAEPGAGKSTLVPLALLKSLPGKILVLEPRRVAAKLLATFVSGLNESALGQAVGYHVRFDRKVGSTTRLIYLTEGLLRRYIQSDPFLAGVDAVVIDEFHERSLNADVGLMLLKKIQKELRPDLRIVVMSATLDAQKASRYLGGAPVVQVAGRGFPVSISYTQKILDPFSLGEISNKVLQALRNLVEDPSDDGGHVLVFLPGQREIRAVQEFLNAVLATLADRSGSNLVVLPLFSQLPENEIRRALESRARERKILLATNIAESSLTLNGLTSVIDTGLQRRSNISTPHLVPYLELTRISRASADQRSGRAGRQAPGRAIRLWSESDQRFLEEFEIPEVLRTDPSQEILSLVDIGFDSIANLPWLDAPRADTVTVIIRKLEVLRLIDRDPNSGVETLTALARGCLDTSIELRWALFLEHLVREVGHVDERSLLRACTSELGSRDKDEDLETLVDLKTAQLKSGPTYRALQNSLGSRYRPHDLIPDGIVVRALTRSFLDRLARVRVRQGAESDKALMWGNRGLRLPPQARVEIHREDFLLAFDVDDSEHSNQDSRLRVYRWVFRKVIESLFSAGIREKTWAEADTKSGALRFYRAKFLNDFQIQDALPAAPDPVAMKEHRIREIVLAWPEIAASDGRVGQVLRRLKLAGKIPGDESIRGVLESLEQPPPEARVAANSEELGQAIELLYPYALRQELERLYPRSLTLRGRLKNLDYRVDGRVFLSTRLPDLFGLADHPSIDRGRIKIHLEILSPAGRPWQITQDLPGFWRGSYLEIRKEMKARYPRQPWPDDPWNPQPLPPPR